MLKKILSIMLFAVNVIACPNVQSFSASPSVAAVGENVDFDVIITAPTAISIKNWTITVNTIPPSADKKILNGNGGGKTTRSATFATKGPRIASITGSYEITENDESKVPGTGFKGQTTADLTIYTFSLDSVTNADSIGKITSSATDVYATSKGTGNVIVAIKTDPVDVVLPTDAISWTGGATGSDQRHRNLSKSSLAEAGVAINATAGTVAVNNKVYVFEGEPTAKAVEVNEKRTDDGKVSLGAFGSATYIDTVNTTGYFNVYYKDAQWKFVFQSISYPGRWGLDSKGRTDIYSGEMDPFPNGLGMPSNSSQNYRKLVAKMDLLPLTDNNPVREYYWSSNITMRHENFHLDDWRINYFTPRMAEAESLIEGVAVSVTLSNLSSDSALDSARDGFISTILAKIMAGYADFNQGSDIRAYADGASHYNSLAGC